MQCTGHAAGIFRITAQGTYGGFQFSGGGGAVGRTLGKQGFEFWVLDVFSALLETLLAVDAGLDQVVQYGDRFFIDVSHFSIPCTG